MALDFKRLFESSPALYLVVQADAPRYTIVAASDAFLVHTLTKREEIVGRGLFEAFPDNPDDPSTSAAGNASASLARVVASRAPDQMPMQRHDVPRPREEGGGFEERWWIPVNAPLFGPSGQVEYILLRVENVTDVVREQRAVERARGQILEVQRKGQDELRELIDSAPDGIFIADPDGRYLDVNAAGCRLLGYTRDEIIGRSITEFVAPEQLPRQATLKRHVLNGGAEVSEWLLRRKDGSYVPVELSANALPDGRLRAFVRDVSERAEADELRRQSEAQFSGIVSIAADAIISIDDDHRITLFNDGAEKIFGYSRAEVLGAPLDMLLPERLRAIHAEYVRAFAAGGQSARRMGERTSVIVGLRKNGEEFPADASISRLTIGGKVLLTVSLRDVTELKLVEDEERLLAETSNVLIDAGADYQRILTDVATLVVRDLADWCVVDLVQPGGVSRIKVAHSSPEKSALCKELQDYPLDRSAQGILSETLASKRSLLFSEVPTAFVESVARSENHLRMLRELDPRSMIVTPLVARGHSLGVLTLGSSSARRYSPRELALAERLASRIALAVDNARLYGALEQAVQTRDDVLAVVAHDLRNPLNTLVLEAELVRSVPPDAAAQRALRFADGVIRSVQRMDTLIQDLLDAARAGQGGMPIRCRAIAPAPLLVEAAETQRLLASQVGLELRLDVAGSLPQIWADPQRLLQVIVNLCANAMKFTQPGGTITLGGSRQGDDVVFRVEDTGRGISEALLPHVFDRFWQANPGDRRGAGLGLSIAKSIVEGHRGTISVDSKPGVGTTFRFTVPIAPSIHTSEAEPEHYAH